MAAPSALPSPSIPRAQPRQLKLLRSFWRRSSSTRPSCTSDPKPTSFSSSVIHILLLAAAFTTKSEQGHTGNTEFPRFGQTKSLLSFTSVSFKKVLLVASHPQASLFQSAAQFGNSRVRNGTALLGLPTSPGPSWKKGGLGEELGLGAGQGYLHEKRKKHNKRSKIVLGFNWHLLGPCKAKHSRQTQS